MSMEQLGGWVRERRKQLGLTQEEAAARGPMSDKTLLTVESCKAAGVRKPTRRALERVLQWEPGSVDDAIDKGHQPRPLPGTEDSPADLGDDTSPGETPTQADPFASAKVALALREQIPALRASLEPSLLEQVLADLVRSQRDAEITLSKAMQWIADDDSKRREAAKLLYQLQQPL